MAKGFIVTGTDTDVGKTVFCAALAGALKGTYWKPIQAGREPETDRYTVAQLSGLPEDHIRPEVYILNTPCSPHRAAELDGVTIDRSRLNPPTTHNAPLIIEGAGGILVPITPDLLQIELFSRWNLPVILVARTALGTINHTLLSVEALNARKIPLRGIVFIGEENKNTQDTIQAFSKARILGRLPVLKDLNRTSLHEAFQTSFDLQDFC